MDRKLLKVLISYLITMFFAISFYGDFSNEIKLIIFFMFLTFGGLTVFLVVDDIGYILIEG